MRLEAPTQTTGSRVLYGNRRGLRFDPMGGMERLGILAVRSPDPVLSIVGPLGLAASVGTALVIDMAGGLRLTLDRTLADLSGDGPKHDELSPGRQGVAILAAGQIETGDAISIIEKLAVRWPAVVVRVSGDEWPGPTVPVEPLYPGWLAPSDRGAAVWQPVANGASPPGPGPVLPRLRGRTTQQFLSGQLPMRSKWVRAWEQVWRMPWA
jgi:hypothetical protein